MRNYIISEKAILDLENIWLYTFEKWSAEQANRYYKLLIEEIEYIAEDYERGREANHINHGYWMSKVKSHLIFYKLNENTTVVVIRIFHERMDIENRLK
jgi:toxin ParE1/3/4